MVPNILHFIFGMAPDFGGKPFSLVHYLSVRSAVSLNKPEAAYFHYEYEPAGEWWERAKPFLRLNKISAPERIAGNELRHVAHKADVVRLRMLNEIGGIYLDLDTISVKPFTELRNAPFLIGQELRVPYVPKNFRQKVKYAIRKRAGMIKTTSGSSTGLCNAVLFSEAGSEFVNLWLDSYSSFRSKGRDKFWNEHSVKIPEKLAAAHPGLLRIEGPYSFHYPLYDAPGLRAMFEEVNEYPQAYLHHLWESFSWEKYLKELSPEKMLQIDTTYNILARKWLTA